MSVHLIWDNSNIWLGGKDTCLDIEPGATASAFRIHFQNLYDLVLNTRQPGQRYFGGSVPPEANALWVWVRKLGCETNLLHRIESGKEQAVDEILHLKMANLLLKIDPPDTIALLTGNGHTSQFESSFPMYVEMALTRAWEVEIYSWEGSMNHTVYDPILEKNSNAKYVKLDDYYGYVTFIQEGEYRYTVKGRKQDSFQRGREPDKLSLPIER